MIAPFKRLCNTHLRSISTHSSKLYEDFIHVAVRCGEGDPKAAVLWSGSDGDVTGGINGDVAAYTKCWRNKWGLDGGVGTGMVLRPSSRETVEGFVEYCAQNGVGIVPQGGNTGLVGGGVPSGVGDGRDEVVLSTVRLNRLMELDPEEGVVTLDAGVVLQSAIEYCGDRGFVYPVDIGAKGTCQVGGNVSSNAGGMYYNRFGSVRENLVGLEVVTGGGDVLDLTRNLMRKNSAGMDLKQLFVGGEGAYGIVTKVVMRVHRKPRTREVAVLGVEGWKEVIKVVERIEERMANLVSAIELMDRDVLNLVGDKLDSRPGWAEGGSSKYFVLVETMGFDIDNDREAVEGFLEGILEEGTVEDGIMAKGEEEIEDIWGIRESCGVAVNGAGGSWKYDVSLRLRDWEEVKIMVEERVGELGGRVVIWGHLGDRNVHLNIVRDEEDRGEGDDITKALEPWLYEEVVRRGGSVSAEHGIGQCKGDLMESLIVGKKGMEYMKGIKKLFDPKGILNVGTNKTFS